MSNNAFKENFFADFNSEKKGFSLDLKLTPIELFQLRDLISEQWLDVIHNRAVSLVNQFKKNGMENYHMLSHLLPHRELWTKSARILPKKSVEIIYQLPFFYKLKTFFGEFTISDEENFGYEEIYWRLVRPNEPGDVGPMHADYWFWELGHGATPEKKQRVKIWIPIFCEPGLNGLGIVPGSHVRDWKYMAEKRDGFFKPQFDQSQVDLPMILPKTNPGETIIFNDKLLHKGVLNKGSKTRVSLEFTMFVDMRD